MAITTVNPRYEGFIFDGENSRDYGIYVQDVKVFGAPTRDVEMISIPGRDGEFALDKGRFNNIQVVYTCAFGTDTQTDFNTGVSDFRNWLASRKGYKRLEDEINTTEYRMAVFKDGLDVSTLNKETGTFEVTFDCKPQRFLKSGEIPRTIGGSVTDTQTESGAVVSLESDGGDKAASLIATIEAVQAGSGDPSPSNVRAITGWSTVNATVDGKNLLDTSEMPTAGQSGVTFARSSDGIITVGGHANANTYRVIGTLQTKNGVQYTLTGTPSGGASGKYRMTVGGYGYDYGNGYTFTGDGGAHLVSIDIYTNYPATGSTLTFAPMIRLASDTDGTYEPYTGTTTTTALGRTVYGGTVDVVTGVLTVTWVAARIGGLAWGYNSNGNYFYTSSVSKATGAFNILSDIYATATIDDVTRMGDYHIKGSAANNNVFVTDSRYTTAADFKTANDQRYIYVEVATPQTYNLTTHEVELLAGQNNVWADTGDITLTYGRDPNKLVNPTLFESRPLLQVWGYGDIDINDEIVSVSNVPIGRVIIANAEQAGSGRTYYTGNQYAFTIDPSALNAGDDIYGMYMDGNRLIGKGLTYTIYALTAVGYEPITGTVTRISEHAFDFEYGTADTFTIVNNNLQYEILRISDAQTITGVLKYRIEVAYDGDRAITVTPYYVGTTFTEGIQQQGILFGLGHDTLYGDSTISALGTPLLIDLDIGEAYKEENGEIISSNAGVSLPAKLPTLNPGATDITYSNAVTQLKIVPRWWEV